jgi:hypothetical protein
VEAKMDTGAGSSSIDEALAQDLGYGQAMERFKMFKENELPKIDLAQFKDSDENKKINLAIKGDGLEEVALIISSHGFSVRPVVNLKMNIAGMEINSKCNIYNRSGLKYKLIVGKEDLTSFLIDASK